MNLNVHMNPPGILFTCELSEFGGGLKTVHASQAPSLY